jgi:hypothetical protein
VIVRPLDAPAAIAAPDGAFAASLFMPDGF